ncbi:MAG: MFS transporter, partial [Pseudomonadota bacterium]
LMTAAGFGLLVFAQDFWALVASRAIAGAGQGALLIGAQAYAMAAAPPEHRTRAAAFQVFAYNAGFLCGASIGGMMYDYGDADVVIRISLVIGLVVVYMAATTPKHMLRLAPDADAAPARKSAPLRAVFSDRGFVLTLGLAGALSKFILAGVVTFGAPFFLIARGWTADTVGQMLMTFAIATLVAIPLASRLSDRSGDPGRTVVLGVFASAAGVMIFSLPLLPPSALFAGVAAGGLGDALCSLGGLILLGLGQGATAASLIAEIARTRVAEEHGRDATLGVYRLLERGGHITGPAVIARAGASAGSSALFVFGVGVAGCAALYAVLRPKSDRSSQGAKT